MIIKSNKDGKTPQILSYERNHQEVFDFLKSKNKDKISFEELDWGTPDINKNDNIKSKKKKKKKNPNNKTSQIINYTNSNDSENEKIAYSDKIVSPSKTNEVKLEE